MQNEQIRQIAEHEAQKALESLRVEYDKLVATLRARIETLQSQVVTLASENGKLRSSASANVASVKGQGQQGAGPSGRITRHELEPYLAKRVEIASFEEVVEYEAARHGTTLEAYCKAKKHKVENA